MGWNNIKINKADTLFSRYIRLKHKKCMYCGRRGEGPDGIFGLQASHYFGRAKQTVRFDEENVDVLCIACHRKLGTLNRPEYERWKREQLGERYDILNLRAHTTGKRDYKLQEIIWKEKLKEYDQ